VVDDVIPFGSRNKEHFKDIVNFPLKSLRVGVKKK
jgi:hypothetical protein